MKKKARRSKKLVPIGGLALSAFLAVSWIFVHSNEKKIEPIIVTEEGYYCRRVLVIFKDTALQTEIDAVIASLNGTIAYHLPNSKMFDIEFSGNCSKEEVQKNIEKVKPMPGVENAFKSYPA